MKNFYKKGFTLIELLVVIAIIGVLSAVVLASLNTARAKGSNATVKGNMHGLRAEAELIYNDNSGSYTVGLCTDTKILELLNGASVSGTGAQGNAVCDSADTYWVASVALKTPDGNGSTHWCVDNTGMAKGEMADIVVGTDTACP